jgi:predicted phage terminase large subunit-like protein
MTQGAPALDPVRFLVTTARTNFAAFVAAVHRPRYTHSVFSAAVCRAVDRFVEDLLAGKRPVLMLTAPPQHGKQLGHSTPMLTANRGWTTHGALVPGDVLYRPDGTTTRVMAVSDESPCDMQITFSDGARMATHARHEWLLHRTWVNGRSAQIFETEAIAAKGAIRGTPGRRGSRANFQLPDVAPLIGAPASLPVAPYALGVWLGDGVRSKPVITAHPDDRAMLDAVAACGYPQTNEWAHATTGVLSAEFSSLRAPLRELGLYNEGYRHEGMWLPKSIPDSYYGASIEQRLELLAGLIDSDGYVYAANGRVTFSTCERELSRSVARLVATFGWRVTTTWFDPILSTSGIQGRKPVAQVCFQPTLPIPCRLLRKRSALKLDPAVRRRSITNVERGAFELGRCIQVAHEDGLYLAGDTLVPTHNSSLIARCLPPYLFGRLTGELPAVRIASASYAHGLAQRNQRDAKNIMREPIYREIFPHTALLGFSGIDNATDGLQVPGDGWLRGVGIGGALTGFSVDVGIIDDAVKNAQEALSEVTQARNRDWYDSVFLTRLQQRSGQVIIGTPWSAQDLLAHVRKALADDPSFTLLSFPAINRPDEIGFNDALPEGVLVPHLHSEDKLRELKRHMGEMWWASMYQQTPLADFGAIFKRMHLQHYKRADLPQTFQQMCMSVDATFKDGDASDFVAIGVWGKTADERVWLIDYRRERLAFMKTAEAIADLKRKHPRATRIFIEEAANGAALIDMLKKHFPGLVGVPPLGSKEARAHAVSWVWENKCVMLPDPSESPGIVPWVTEITAFPDVKNDDTVDCMTIALQQLCLRTPIASMITQEILNKARA